MTKKMRFLYLIILGSLSAFGFAPTSAIWLLFIVFPLFIYILNEAKTKKGFFATGFVFGFMQGAVSLFWVTNALLLDAQNLWFLIPAVPVGFGLFFGLFWGLSTLFCYFAPKGFYRILALATSLCFFEWVRSWFLTGFPWNLLGSVWVAFLPILQSASVWGVYGLSFFSVLWFSAPSLIVPQRKFFYALLFSFVLAAGLGFFRLETDKGATVWGIQLRLVQPAIPQTLKWSKEAAEENFEKHIRLSRKEGREKVTHVIWSEAASPFLLDVDEQARAMTIRAVPQGGTLITGSLRRATPEAPDQLANSALVINDVGEIKTYYDKSHLVPFGEYVPLRGFLPFDKVVPIASDLKAGKSVETRPIPNAPKAGLLVCYEVIFPAQVVNPQYRPLWLINLTNDGWYGMSAGPYQHLAAAQLRAVEEGLPLVRVAGSGISAVISPFGQIKASIPLGQEGVLDAPLPRALEPTLYGRLHNTIVFALLGLCGIFLFFVWKNSKKSETL